MNLYEELHTKSVVLFSLCMSNHFLAKYRIKRYYMPNMTKLWADGNYAKNWLFYIIHIMWVSNFSFFISGKMGWKGKKYTISRQFFMLNRIMLSDFTYLQGCTKKIFHWKKKAGNSKVKWYKGPFSPDHHGKPKSLAKTKSQY